MIKQEIIREITQHIELCGGEYDDWYIGITNDVKQRLFTEHAVIENKDAWIFRQSQSNSELRSIEDYFINQLGTDGDTSGGDETSSIIYAYKKGSHTKP